MNKYKYSRKEWVLEFTKWLGFDDKFAEFDPDVKDERKWLRDLLAKKEPKEFQFTPHPIGIKLNKIMKKALKDSPKESKCKCDCHKDSKRKGCIYCFDLHPKPESDKESKPIYTKEILEAWKKAVKCQCPICSPKEKCECGAKAVASNGQCMACLSLCPKKAKPQEELEVEEMKDKRQFLIGGDGCDGECKGKPDMFTVLPLKDLIIK